METKAAALGGADFVMAFSALGLDTFAVEPDPESVRQTAREILAARYGLVIVAENIAPLAQEVFEPVQKEPAPAILVVPFLTESTGFATESLGRALKLATGINILSV